MLRTGRRRSRTRDQIAFRTLACRPGGVSSCSSRSSPSDGERRETTEARPPAAGRAPRALTRGPKGPPAAGARPLLGRRRGRRRTQRTAVPADAASPRRPPRPLEPTIASRRPTRRRPKACRSSRSRSRQPPRLERRRAVVPPREARPPLQGREPRERRPRALGLRLLRRHRGRHDRATTRGVILRFLVRERPNIKAIEFEGNDEIENDKLNEAIEVKAEHDPERARGPPQRPEDQGRLRREGLLPRRRRSTQVEPQRDNEVDRQVQDHRARAGHRSPHHVHRQRQRLRRRAPRRRCRPARRRVLLLRLRRPVPPGRLRARRPHDQRPLLRQGLPERADRHAARDAHARSRGHRDHDPHPRGPALQDPPAPASTSATTTATRSSRSAAAARSAQMVRAQPRRLLQPRRARRRTSRRSARSTATPATPTSRPSPRPSSIRSRTRSTSSSRSAADRSSTSSASRSRATPRRATRCIRREMEIERASSSARRSSRISKRRIMALGYFERVDVSTEQGSTPEQININFEIGEQPDRHVPGRRRLLEHRELHRDRADPAGEPVRQRAVARAPGADLRAPSARQHSLLRAVLPRLRLVDVSVELYDQLLHLPGLRAALARRLAHVRLRAHRSRGSASAHGHGASTTRSTRSRSTRSSAATSGFVSVFQRLPLANLFNDGRTISLRPALTYDTRNNRLFPSSGVFLPGVDRARDVARSAARSSSSATASSGASTTRSSADRAAGLGFILKLNNEVGVITSPIARACRSSRASSSAASSTSAAIRLRSSARACRSTRRSTERAADPERREHRRQPRVLPEPRARVPDHRQGRHPRRRLHRRRQRVEPREAVLPDDARAAVLDASYSPCFNAPAASATSARRGGFGIRWFSPLGPLRFEWGFPLKPLPYEESSVFEFTIGNFF